MLVKRTRVEKMCQNHQSGLKHGFMVNMNHLMWYLHGTITAITFFIIMINTNMHRRGQA
jgi:hypothetical protein